MDVRFLLLFGATVVVFAMFTLLNRNFLSWTNFVNILVATSLVGLVAIGHTYLIIAGQNDLSPGSLAAFSELASNSPLDCKDFSASSASVIC